MKRYFFNVFALMFFMVFAGCGPYRPLYGGRDGGLHDGSVRTQLRSVAIAESDNRFGQMVRNSLLSNLRPAGQAGADRYLLNFSTTISTVNQIEMPLPRAWRRAAVATVTFELIERDGNKKLYSGSSFAQVSYDILRQPVSDVQAENNALKRAAEEVSSEIGAKLAGFFSKL